MSNVCAFHAYPYTVSGKSDCDYSGVHHTPARGCCGNCGESEKETLYGPDGESNPVDYFVFPCGYQEEVPSAAEARADDAYHEADGEFTPRRER